MSRLATGTVSWRRVEGVEGWHARVTATDANGQKRRPWVDLERPDLKNTPGDKEIAKRLALKRARLAAKGTYVGAEQATSARVTLVDLEEKWHALLIATRTSGRRRSRATSSPGSTSSRCSASWPSAM